MLSANTQAILLLTCYFSKAMSSEASPLTNKEWGRFAYWLKNQELVPEDLLSGDVTKKLSGWADTKITANRIQTLLNRGSALAMAMEKWTRSGLWVLTRSDQEYPKRLKARLGNDAPPVFFGCGNRNLLSQGGIAVIGSRNTSDKDLQYSRDFGAKVASQGLSIVSGGARGVDESAMLGALEAEGTAVGVLANELLRNATSAKYRKYLMANNLLLLSPFYPEAGFNAGNAMQRNKYIYCLGDTAVAVHSGTKGGTWNGALENMKHGWIPLWVKPTIDPAAGNAQLVQKGAHWLPDNIATIDINQLFQSPSSKEEQAVDLFSQHPPVVEEKRSKPEEETEPDVEAKKSKHEEYSVVVEKGVEGVESETQVVSKELSQLSLYQHFLILLEQETRSPKTVDELLEVTCLQKSQLNVWLKQAQENDKIEKLSRPVRYQWAHINQREMFKEQ